MNWTKWSSIAEITSSIAIVLTLIYLAIQTQQIVTQTQQNTAAILSGSRQESLNAELQLTRMIFDDPITSFSVPLEPGQIGLKQRIVDVSLFRVREQQWVQRQAGLLDEATMQTYLSTLVINIQGSERVRQHWNNFSNVFVPGFVADVDRILAGAQ